MELRVSVMRDPMKILALYDIHGNIDALDAVLADPRAQGCDAVVVGGDAVPGAFAAEVLDRLDALGAPVHRVRGNGEREVAAAVDAPDAADPDDLPLVTAIANARTLGADRAAPLGALPLTVVVDGVLFCHATPRDDEELLTRLSPPERYEAALAGVEQPLVVAGHTHQQDDRTVGPARFVNAGSVGLSYEGDGAARWLLVDDGEPRFMSTTYDHAAAGHRILASGWPDAQSTAAAMTDLVPALTITELFESRTGS
jgi:predicted phosphodiesterase